MSAVARPTLVVVASLLVHRATANSDDDDDESNEHLSYAVWIACGLFVILFLLFDLLRTRMWWVYEPRLHHDSYRARTPHAPGRSKWFRVAWLQKVFAYWSDEDFLLYAGVDGLAITYFLRFATDVCVFRAASTSPARRAAPDDLAARTAERRRRAGR